MSSQRINLLPQDEFSQTTLGRTLTWALSTGRIIVILTELVVISAFLLRFILDVKITDLSDSIAAKKALIESSAEFENSFRASAKKIEIYDLLKNRGFKTSLYEDIAKQVPDGVILTNITFEEGTLEIKGNSSSERQIQVFIKLLGNLPGLGSVKTSQASFSSQLEEGVGGIGFTLLGTIEAKGDKNGI